jgi:hypothetical protein
MAKAQTTFPPDLLQQISQAVIDADAAHPYTGARDDNPQFLEQVLRAAYGLTAKVYGAGQYLQWIVDAGVARRPNPATVNKAVQGFRERLRENASIPLELAGIIPEQRARLQQAANTFYGVCFESASATFEIERMELGTAVGDARAQAAGLKLEVERRDGAVVTLRGEKAALQEQVAQLEARLEQVAAARADEEARRQEAERRLMAEREKLGAQIAHLQEALRHADDARKFALLQIEEARSETRAWCGQHDDARKMLDKTQAELAASRERAQQIALEHAQASVRAESQAAEVARLTGRLEAVITDRVQAQEAQRAANSKVESLEARVEALRQELHAAQRESLGAMLGPRGPGRLPCCSSAP